MLRKKVHSTFFLIFATPNDSVTLMPGAVDIEAARQTAYGWREVERPFFSVISVMKNNTTCMKRVRTASSQVMPLLLLNFFLATQAAEGSFHLMQIEQIIGGVNGDTTAQAIQLRMRFAGQNLVGSTKVEVVDAAGANPVLLENMTTSVPNGQAGRRILLTTPNFAAYTNIPLVSDFVMDPIPLSYLAAGQVRFMSDFGTTILWSVSWGGANYTGSTTGAFDNDSNGNFGPPVGVALPSASLQALQFTGAANAASTTNLAQYAITAGAATFINNANTSFTLVAPPDPETGDFDDDGDVDGQDFLIWQRGESPNPLGSEDLALWRDQFGNTTPLAPSVAAPEPAAGLLIVASMAYLCIVVRQPPAFPVR